MKRILLFALACQIDRHVEILLGPDKDTPSAGFICKDPADASKFLIERALDATTNQLHFNLIVDVLDLGVHFPSCLAEDIVNACADGTCRLSTSVAPQRFCQHVVVDNVVNLTEAPRQITDALTEQFPIIFTEAPHKPVILRAVITTDDYPCAPLDVADAGVYPSLDGSKALGCAYSCPVSLDDAPATISLGLDTSLAGSDASLCEAAVAQCAEFPSGNL